MCLFKTSLSFLNISIAGFLEAEIWTQYNIYLNDSPKSELEEVGEGRQILVSKSGRVST